MANKTNSELADKYLSLSKTKKELFWTVLVDLAVFIILVPFFTIGWLKLSLGWLIGSLASIASNLLTNLSAKAIFSQSDPDKKSGALNGVVFYMARIFIWAIVLAISGICTFKAEWFNGFDLFYFWTAFAAYFPGLIILIINNTISKRRIEGEGK